MFDIHATPAAAFAVSVDGDEFRFTDLNAECLRCRGITVDLQIGNSPIERFAGPMADLIFATIGAQSRQLVSCEIVDASFGTAVQEPSDRTLTDLIQRADAALYAIKNHRWLSRA